MVLSTSPRRRAIPHFIWPQGGHGDHISIVNKLITKCDFVESDGMHKHCVKASESLFVHTQCLHIPLFSTNLIHMSAIAKSIRIKILITCIMCLYDKLGDVWPFFL